MIDCEKIECGDVTCDGKDCKENPKCKDDTCVPKICDGKDCEIIIPYNCKECPLFPYKCEGEDCHKPPFPIPHPAPTHYLQPVSGHKGPGVIQSFPLHGNGSQSWQGCLIIISHFGPSHCSSQGSLSHFGFLHPSPIQSH